MSDFSENLDTPRKESCPVGLIFATDDFTDKDRARLANPNVEDSAIVKALDRQSIHTSTAAVHNHRHGDCRCHPDLTANLRESNAPSQQLDRYAAKNATRQHLTANRQQSLHI